MMDLCRFHFHLLLVFATCAIFVHFNLSISAASVNSSEIQAMMYLQKYGYMNESSFNSASIMSQKTVQTAIKEFQRFSRLPETGELNNTTLNMMNLSCCGVKDDIGHSGSVRRKRYALQGRPRREAEAATPDLCLDATINAVTRTEDGRTYLFKGDHYWELMGEEKTWIGDGYPRKIREDWGGLPGNLDAALTWADGNTFFFKKNEYWRFRNKKMDSGFPKEISDGFVGIPNSIDAAFVWSGDGKTYFFKGSEYWRYIDLNDTSTSISNPQPISTWTGLPNNIDAAMQWANKETYFFKEKKYYRFDDKLNSVVKDDRHPPYPRSTSFWWLSCEEQLTSNKGVIKTSLLGDDIAGDNNMMTPPSRNEVLDTNSAASSCASLFLSLLLVAIL